LYAQRSRVINISTNVSTNGAGSTIITEQVTEIRAPKPDEVVAPEPPVSRTVKELSTNEKVSVMVRALEAARKDLDKERRKKSFFKRLALVLVAGILLLSTGYVGIDTWLTNSRLQAEATPPPANAPAEAVVKDVEATSATVATDVDKTPPPVSALASYKVDPDLPRALYISSLNIAARVQQMGLTDSSSLQAPKNIYDAGWYTGSAKPGQSGAMVIDGHASETGSRYGLFGYIERLKEGDIITIEKGDGTKLNYVVAHTEVDALSDVDMKSVRSTYGGAAQGLNIITCTGKWTDDKSTLDHRLIVFATLQS
jgi:sortase (surface protein transpeptidase)